MAEEQEKPACKQTYGFLTGEEDLPTYYVNMVNIRTSLEDFFLTFGTVVPTHYVEDPEELDNLKVRPLFRCAMSRSRAQDLIRLLTQCYEHQTTLIEELQDAPTIHDAPGRRD